MQGDEGANKTKKRTKDENAYEHQSANDKKKQYQQYGLAKEATSRSKIRSMGIYRSNRGLETAD